MGRVMSQPPDAASVTQRVQERVARERRQRFVRHMVFFVIVTAAMVFAIVAQRDARTVRQFQDDASEIARQLQQQLERSGEAPAGLATTDPRLRRVLAAYRFNPGYAVRARADRPAAVYVLGRPIDLFLRPSGRPVVLFDGKRFIARWFDEDELRARADELGIGTYIERPAG